MTPTRTIETAVQLRWLRAKRHLRSLGTSARVEREAARAAEAGWVPSWACLCRDARLAA